MAASREGSDHDMTKPKEQPERVEEPTEWVAPDITDFKIDVQDLYTQLSLMESSITVQLYDLKMQPWGLAVLVVMALAAIIIAAAVMIFA